LKPTRANSLQKPFLKKNIHKKGLVEWLKVQSLSSNTSTTKKKELFPGLTVNYNPPDLSLPHSWNCRCEPWVYNQEIFFLKRVYREKVSLDGMKAESSSSTSPMLPLEPVSAQVMYL
jgi:hypothetical protein